MLQKGQIRQGKVQVLSAKALRPIRLTQGKQAQGKLDYRLRRIILVILVLGDRRLAAMISTMFWPSSSFS